MKKQIIIEGMSCGHCTARVEKALKATAGVTEVNVDLDNKCAIIEAEGIEDNQLKEIIDDAGYDVVDIKNI